MDLIWDIRHGPTPTLTAEVDLPDSIPTLGEFLIPENTEDFLYLEYENITVGGNNSAGLGHNATKAYPHYHQVNIILICVIHFAFGTDHSGSTSELPLNFRNVVTIMFLIWPIREKYIHIHKNKYFLEISHEYLVHIFITM